MILCWNFAGSIKKPGRPQANLPSDPQGQISERGPCPTGTAPRHGWKVRLLTTVLKCDFIHLFYLKKCFHVLISSSNRKDFLCLPFFWDLICFIFRFNFVSTSSHAHLIKLEFWEIKYRLMAFLVLAESKLKSWIIKYGRRDSVELLLQSYLVSWNNWHSCRRISVALCLSNNLI